MVDQVQVVAILMIVNGSFVTLMGVFYVLLGPTMFAFMRLAPQAPPGSPAPGTVEMTVLPLIYIVMGLPVLVAGVLNIVAGVRSLKFRGRMLALVALFANLVPMFTCYCMPTSVGLMIYGLIVFFQADVARAFEMVAAGVPPERVKHCWRRDEEEERDDEEIDEENIPRSSATPSTDIQLDPRAKSRKSSPEE